MIDICEIYDNKHDPHRLLRRLSKIVTTTASCTFFKYTALIIDKKIPIAYTYLWMNNNYCDDDDDRE